VSAISAMSAARELAYAARGGSAAQPKRLAAEFEALLLGEVWKGAMRPMGLAEGLMGGSAAQLYRDAFVEEVSRSWTSQRTSNLAVALERDIVRQDGNEDGGGSSR